ncbi:MAG TPA: prepilin-type N-terminal cleavage/methylation domain-containing protein [Gemmatimonadales bacterium]|nr:prepilin-type N-terminal cleavage/methylation domain-containing protein [Gemmatimonadales bacterium]
MTSLRNRSGFTIIELMATVAIVGVLASMAILKSRQSRDKALRASMMVDLRTLVSAQEVFFSANKDYAGGIAGTEVAGLGGAGRAALAASNGNAIRVRYRATNGWSATVTSTRLNSAPRTCGIYIGLARYAPNAAVNREGVPACY